MQTIYDQYEAVIGLEVHVQLNTQSKAFCGDAIQFGAQPNLHTSPISLAHPGTLPRINKAQVIKAVQLGLAIGSTINPISYFDRKNYFYADLPKGYQITQDANPICIGGTVPVFLGENLKSFQIHHIHMEEDAGKSIHDQDPTFSLIDLNRAGVPLLEIVTEPDFRSADEVAGFMTALRQLVRYLDISDGNMEEGSLRCDVNVSVRKKGVQTLGNRCEVKNMNSMRFAKKAIEYEFKRQIDILEKGGEILQQTRSFDPDSGTTAGLREKEDAHDYRYFPDPDLPPLSISKEELKDLQAKLPPLPWTLVKEFQEEIGLSKYDSDLLTENKEVALLFKDLLEKAPKAKTLANLFINKIIPILRTEKEIKLPIEEGKIIDLLKLIDEGIVGNSAGTSALFPALLDQPNKTVVELAQELNLIQSENQDFLGDLAKEIMKANPDKVNAYRKGKKGLIGFFVGQLIRNSKGKADPKKANQILTELLNQ